MVPKANREFKQRKEPGCRRAAHIPAAIQSRIAALDMLRHGAGCDPELAAVLLATDDGVRKTSAELVCDAVQFVGRTW